MHTHRQTCTHALEFSSNLLNKTPNKLNESRGVEPIA
jgi:hypothetical protein